HQGAFHLGGPDPMPRHIDHVIHAARDPVVAVLIAPAAVAREVHARILNEISVLEAGRIPVNGSHYPRPRGFQAQIPLGGDIVRITLTLLVDDHRADAEEGERRRPRLRVERAGKGRDQDPAGFRLPPGVYDGAATLPHVLLVPEPGFRVD